jgi:acyl carrier protein
MKEEIIKKLEQIISAHLGIPPEQLSDDISYETESDWDSITHLQMISDIENAFNFSFEIEEITCLETIGNIKESVLKKVG